MAAPREVEAFKTEAVVLFATTAAIDVDAVVMVFAVDAVPAVMAAAILVDATVVFALTAAVPRAIFEPREVDAARTVALVLALMLAGIVARSDVLAERTVALVFALTLVAIPEILVPRDVEALRMVLAVDAVPAVIAAAIDEDAEFVFELIAV